MDINLTLICFCKKNLFDLEALKLRIKISFTFSELKINLFKFIDLYTSITQYDQIKTCAEKNEEIKINLSYMTHIDAFR